jgi:hypothetical protein
MGMGSKLEIFRGAARLLGDGTVASLSEQNNKRLAFEEAWTSTVNSMLEKAFWNFALRDVALDADTDREPLFGWDAIFTKPDDWVRTAAISDQPDYRYGFEDFQDRPGVWYANVPTLYVSYVSDAPEYGWNIGAWRQSFCEALEAYLAFKCGLPISNDKSNRNDLWVLFKSLLSEAKSKDALDEAVQRPPAGRLVRARFGNRFSSLRDR